MKPVVIFGTGTFAEVAYVYLTQDSPHRVAAFTVHEKYLREPVLLGLDIVPYETLEQHFPPSECALFTAVGFTRVNRARTEIYQDCKRRGYECISYINSRATHWGHFEVGENCFILENNVIQPFVRIGNNVIIWSGNHIGHHATIGDNCFIASHAVISGRVTIEPSCFIGVNATLRDGITIRAESVIGAGAIILKDTIEKGVYPGAGTEPGRVRSDQLRGL
jgi:sugar O-acyltransferase (sialic acid O-acetyltransferase NeuD family)